MTVKELITELKDYPQDALVVIGSDEDGNSKSPHTEIEDAVYVPDAMHGGDIYVGRSLTPELKEQGFTKEDCYDGENGQDAVVLWPTG